MARAVFEGPDVGGSWTGYNTIRFEHDDDILLEAHLSPGLTEDVLESFGDPEYWDGVESIADALSRIFEEEP